MVVEIGKVIEARGSSAVVVVSRGSACERCTSRDVCMVVSGAENKIGVENRIGARVGDTVEIGVGDVRLAAASAVVYVLPAAALFLGAGMGTWVASRFSLAGGWWSAGMGLLFLVIGLVVIRLLDPYLSKKDSVKPKIVRIVEEHP